MRSRNGSIVVIIDNYLFVFTFQAHRPGGNPVLAIPDLVDDDEADTITLITHAVILLFLNFFHEY
jgi:hypothetical protein